MGQASQVSPPIAGGSGTAGTSTIGRAAHRLAALRRVFLLDAWIHELELVGGTDPSKAIEHFRRERDRLVRVHRLDEERP